jgi:hypothetical protein
MHCVRANIEGLVKDIELGNGGGQFQVAVGDRASGVGRGNKLLGNGRGPRFTPEKRKKLAIRESGKVYPAQTFF